MTRTTMRTPILPLLTAVLFLACGGGGLSGTYMLQGGGTSFTFHDDGSYHALFFGDTIHGTYRIDGDSVIMEHPGPYGRTDREAALLEGDAISYGPRRFIRQ